MIKVEQILLLLKKSWGNRKLEENLPFIIVGVLSAVVCSFFAIVFARTETFSLKFFSTYEHLMYLISPLAMVGSYLIVRWFAPGSSGSGIPQVITCIDKNHRHLSSLFLRKSVIVIKMLSSLMAIFAGAAIGREGPSLQISAAISHNVGQLFQRFNVRVKMDQLLVAGAASGLAAAFNTPIGGIVYAIEELSQDHIRSFKDVLLISVVIAGLTAQLINGNYLYLGYPEIVSKGDLMSFMLVALVGCSAGILGACFSKILTFLLLWRARRTFSTQLAIVVGAGLVLALSFYFLGSRSVYSGHESINHVLFSKEAATFTEMFSRFLMPLVSSMTGIAGGIFAPSLSAGAAFGGIVSDLLDPAIRTTLVLSGMVGFLTGVTRTPITSFILVLEMTDRHSAVFPMMLSAVLASLTAYLVSSKSFYDESVELIKAEDNRSNARLNE